MPRLGAFHRNQVRSLLTSAERKLNPCIETYLDGNSGQQGLSVLLDELNAYARDALEEVLGRAVVFPAGCSE